MSDYPMLISNKLHSFRNFDVQYYRDLHRFSSYRLMVIYAKDDDSMFQHLSNGKKEQYPFL